MGWLDRFNPEHPNYSVGDTGGFTGPTDPVTRVVDNVRNMFYEEPKYAWELGDYYLNGNAPDYIKSDGGIGGHGHAEQTPIDPPGDEDPDRLLQIFRKSLESGQPAGLAYTNPSLGYQTDPGSQKVYDQWKSQGSPITRKRRVSYDTEMNLRRQQSVGRARADEARRRGDADLADYIEHTVELMTREHAEGRTQPFKKHFWPMVQEEYGDERAGPPEGRLGWVNDPPEGDPPPRKDYIDRGLREETEPQFSPLYFDPDSPGLKMPSDMADPKFMNALEEMRRLQDISGPLAGPPRPPHDPGFAELMDELLRESRLALQNPGRLPIAPPSMDWGPVMDSVKGTGGYTVGDAGESPTSGYMISQPNTEERRPTDTVTPATEDDYHKRHWDELAEDPDLYQGGWDSSGTFYTDLSRNDQDLYRTVGDAVTTDQLGIYDYNRGQTLDTYDNPETDRDDYNPLLVSPGPVMAFGARAASVEGQPGLSPRERRDSWRNLESLMQADVDTYGLDRTPGGHVFAAAMREFTALDEHVTLRRHHNRPTPRQIEKLRQRQNPKKESLDPNMLDDRIDMDVLIRNALSRYNGATDEQRRAGRDWYATARARAEELARRTGGDFSKAAAVIAAMSPQMEWEGNLNAAAHFLNTYDPAAKHDWRRPNISHQALNAWNKLNGGRTPQTPEDFATLAQLNGTHDDESWAKEMAMDGRWDRASGLASKRGYKYRPYTGTGLPTLGDNVLRAMNVYDSDDPRQLLDYAKGGPKIHSFWRNFLGDEDYVTVDKHMLRALDRGFGEDPLLSYGSGKPEVTRKVTPEDKRVNELEGLLGLQRSLKGDEQQSVPTGYNTYAEAIRRATAQANAGMANPSQHVTPAQMQAIIWVQHKDDMDAFRKRKSQEAFEQANPGKTYTPPGPSKYVPAVPTNGPAPDYYQTDEWARENPYKGGTPRPTVPDFHGKPWHPDNIPDPHLGPQEMSIMPAAPWADPAWSRTPEMPKAAGRWSRRRELLRR